MKKVVLKITDSVTQSCGNMQKTVGLINAKSMFNLLDVLDLSANPRIAKSGQVTDQIMETLEKTPELYFMKSKGILVSARSKKDLDRGRIELHFVDEELEGIMDGGHNTFAIGLYMLKTAIPENNFKPKTWSDLADLWKKHSGEVSHFMNTNSEEFSFNIPFEVVLPVDNHCIPEFIENIFEISAARNNNCELNSSAKGNHAGFYDPLREYLPASVEEKVEWKTNEAGKSIKAADMIALATLPLMELKGVEGVVPINLNKVSLYSSKGSCVNAFNSFIEDNIEGEFNPKDIKFKSPLVNSAFKIAADLPRIYDIVYKKFPEAYNKNGGAFGAIGKVSVLQSGKKRTTGFYTKFYGMETKHKYPEGFIAPIIGSLGELMRVENEEIKWIVPDPADFIDNNLAEIVKMLCSFIKAKNSDPQQVGKEIGSYDAVKMQIENVLLRKGIKIN